MSPADFSRQIPARLRSGVASSAELEASLKVSQSAISRAMRTLIEDRQVLKIGSTRGARYGLRREVQGIGSAWPLRKIDAAGAILEFGVLYALAADQYYFEPSPAAKSQGFGWEGLSPGMPYFLQDQRPGGFLGRAVPLNYPELELPPRVVDWTDDHCLRYLVQRGSDTVSNLILGNESFDSLLIERQHPASIATDERQKQYPKLVAEVMQGGLPGSSAHGENPKFTALLRDASGVRHVLVKFSPPTDTDVGRRWADLLIAEHHAHEVLRVAGFPAATSRILSFQDRAYLEVDRFDRQGRDGRVGVTSLLAIDASLYGRLDHWIAACVRLHADGRIDSHTLDAVRFVASFGALIANTDRHLGNLAFFDDYTGRFALAPVYDMLPMLFAPEHGQMVNRAFEPPLPTADSYMVWQRAQSLARTYWQALLDEPDISTGFRQIVRSCLDKLKMN